MTPRQLTDALSFLRGMSKVGTVLGEASKAGKGVLDLGSGIWHAADQAAAHGAKALGSAHPVLSGAVRVAPAAAVAYGGKKTWDSEPVQNMRYKYQVWKARRQMEQGQ